MASSTQGAGDEGERHGRVDALLDTVELAGTHVHGHHHIGADGKPHEQVHEHGRHRIHAADARE